MNFELFKKISPEVAGFQTKPKTAILDLDDQI